MNLRSPPLSVDYGLTLDDYLPYRLSVAADAVSRLIARAYEDRFGIAIPQWRLMCVLAEDDASTQAGAALRTGMDEATVAAAAQGLILRRLVERAVSRADGRLALTLSTAGRALFAEIAPLAVAYEAALVAGMAPMEVAAMKRLLARVQSAATALAGEGTR